VRRFGERWPIPGERLTKGRHQSVDIGGMQSLAYGVFFGVMLLSTTLYIMRRRVRLGKKKGTF